MNSIKRKLFRIESLNTEHNLSDNDSESSIEIIKLDNELDLEIEHNLEQSQITFSESDSDKILL